MTEPDQSAAVEGQCGTCKFAAVFDFADTPSGLDDGVHCTSEAQAKMLDEQTGGDCYMQEYKDYGFLSLWRLESIAEPSFRCTNWQQRQQFLNHCPIRSHSDRRAVKSSNNRVKGGAMWNY